MCKTNEVTVGDLLQTADASEMWLVLDVRKNSKLPAWREVRRHRLDNTSRANNDNWRWDWIRIKALTGPDADVDMKDLVLYWDPRKEHCGPQSIRTSGYWEADRLLLPEQAKALQERLASQQNREDWLDAWILRFDKVVDWSGTHQTHPPYYLLTSWLHNQEDFRVSKVKVNVVSAMWSLAWNPVGHEVPEDKFSWTVVAGKDEATARFSLKNCNDGYYGNKNLDWDWEIEFIFQ